MAKKDIEMYYFIHIDILWKRSLLEKRRLFTQSSNASLIILVASTKESGMIEETGLYGDISSKLVSTVIKRKYILASLRNWRYSDFGKNVRSVYLQVLIWFEGYLL